MKTCVFFFCTITRCKALVKTVFVFFTLLFSIEKASDTNYFVNLKSSNVRVRVGPNSNKTTTWILTKKNYPLKVVARYEHWRKVADYQGELGWLHKSFLISKKMYGITTKTCIMTQKKTNKEIARVGKNNIVQILDSIGDSWFVAIKGLSSKTITGLISKTAVWGGL